MLVKSFLFFIFLSISFFAMSSHDERLTPLEDIERGYTYDQINLFKLILKETQDLLNIDEVQKSSESIRFFKFFKALLFKEAFSEKAISEICKQLEYNSQKDCLTYDMLTIGTKKFGLTIPHFIVIFQNEKSFQWLLGVVKKYSLQLVLDKQDKRGWTPSHFAALHKSDNFLKRLKEAGANQEIKNLFGGTAEQVYQITHISDLKEQNVNIWDEDKEMVVSLNGEEFFNKTGVRFVERLKVHPHDMILFWQFKNPSKHIQALRGAEEQGPSIENLDGVYNDLYVKKINLKEIGYEKEQDIGYGLFALKDIPEGKIITDYQGIWVLDGENRIGKEHSTDNIDGTEVRGYAAFANECLPNAYMTRVSNAHGNPGLLVLVSFKTIKKDDMICWDYFSHPIKKGNYLELSKERVNDFIETYGSLSKAIKLNDEYVHRVLLYILGTNSVLTRLALEGHVTKEDLRNLKNSIHAKNIKSYIDNKHQAMSFFLNFGDGLIRFLEILENIPKANKAVLIDYFVNEKSQDLAILKSYFIMTIGATPGMTQFLTENTLSFEFCEGQWLKLWVDICMPYFKKKEENPRGVSSLLNSLKDTISYYFSSDDEIAKNKKVIDAQEAERRAAFNTLKCGELVKKSIEKKREL